MSGSLTLTDPFVGGGRQSRRRLPMSGSLTLTASS
jgi:hypothetical protein